MTFTFRLTPPEGEAETFEVLALDDRAAWRVAWQTFSSVSRAVGTKLDLIKVK